MKPTKRDVTTPKQAVRELRTEQLRRVVGGISDQRQAQSTSTDDGNG